MSQKPSDLRFDIHPSVVFQLGSDLVTDHVQALVELVKNSYDADASYANITVDTRNAVDDPSSWYRDQAGYIVIEDDGFGMDRGTIEGGWLTISLSPKREMKRQKRTTPRGRTPLGDKGLGRLAAQRLGRTIEIFTKPDGLDIEYHVAVAWDDFRVHEKLSAVPVRSEEASPAHRKKGTKVIISGLREPDLWRGNDLPKLQTQLSSLISPYNVGRDFRVVGNVDGKSLEFAEIAQAVLDASELRYDITFDGEELLIEGRARLSYFKPDKDQVEEYTALVESDMGKNFSECLLRHKQAQKYGLRASTTPGWFVSFERRRFLSALDRVETMDGVLANPGPFRARVDSFNLRPDGQDKPSIFDLLSDFRKYIKELSGIRVYRDGFGIRVDADWLKLSQQWTSGRSYYGLRPRNTIGFVELSAKDNADLKETTDREGFVRTPHYENFYSLMSEFIRFSEEVQEVVRREWTEFRKTNLYRISGTTKPLRAEELTRQIKELLKKEELANSIPETRAKKTTEPRIHPTPDSSKAPDVEVIRTSLDLLDIKIAELRQQVEIACETMSLGLTAEALAHEINFIAEQLAERTRLLEKYLSKRNIRDIQINTYLEYAKSSAAAMRSQLSHLAPSLRYVREKKTRIDLSSFCLEIAAFYRGRFSKNRIDFIIEESGEPQFELRMNRGKLTQIVDNLLLNSEYWLREDMRLKRIQRGVITAQLEQPFVRLWDDGRGIDPAIEDSLFEPFITMKARGEGRGLGLFIVQQLLDSEGCSIRLLPERNGAGSMYKFEIDFTGGLFHDR